MFSLTFYNYGVFFLLTFSAVQITLTELFRPEAILSLPTASTEVLLSTAESPTEKLARLLSQTAEQIQTLNI